MEWTDYLTIAFLQVVITVLVWLIASYTKGKGRNLATREDIEKITDKIESVKTEYARELEGLKSQLNAKFHAHTVRFEKEFQVYQEIWKTLLELRNATLKLRPPTGTFIEVPNEPEEEKRKRRLEGFQEAFNAYRPVVYGNRPFVPVDIFNRLDSLSQLLTSEASDYGWLSQDPNEPGYDPNYWDTAKANNDKILQEADAICDLIRQRIERL